MLCKTYLAKLVSLSRNLSSEDRRFSPDIEDISDLIMIFNKVYQFQRQIIK